MNTAPYNPLHKRNLGESVATALLHQPLNPLPPKNQFQGAGIYAIYYFGRLPLYEFIARRNQGDQAEKPIYIGKAIPPGARTGGFGLDMPAGPALQIRLLEHARSLEQAGFQSNDFQCRYLLTDDIWIPLGETLLIERYRPLWNILIDGFGNHDPGGGRRKQQRSKWDTLHPGRSWAELLRPNQKTLSEIEQLVRDFEAGKPVDIIPTAEAVNEDDDGK